MAEKPTPGGSDGTYGTELNAFLDESLASDGKVKDGAVFSTSAAPTVDAGVANKLFVESFSGAAKVWCQFASDGTLQAGSLNMTSVSRDSLGVYTLTFDTNFSNILYVPLATPISTSTTAKRKAYTSTLAAGSLKVSIVDASDDVVDAACGFVAFGAQ